MKKKIYCLFIAMLLVLLPTITVNAVSGEVGGGGSSGGSCACCGWVYSSNQKGLRISLYKYDGKGDPQFIAGIDLLNSPSSLNNKTILAADLHGRFGHTNPTFTKRNVGKRFKSFKSLGWKNIDTNNDNWQQIKEKEIKEYFGTTYVQRQAKLKEMFGVKVDELDKHYIVLEPTIAFDSRCKNTYAFGTGYEFMSNLNLLNNKPYHCSGYTCNFLTSQKGTVEKYLFSGMHVAPTSDGEYDRYKFVGVKGSGSYVYATSVDSVSYSTISSKYTNKSFPYGLGVFWMLTGIADCKSTCAGKTGDALLKCAENYCVVQEQKTKSKTEKKNCIVNQCNYKPNTLSCGGSSSTNGNNTVCSATTSGNKKTCAINELNGISYKVECNSTSTVIFPDTLPKTIIPAEGFEYQVKLYGNKTCTITFDSAKWKLDFASSVTQAERDNLITALNNFNKKIFNESSYKYNSETASMNIKISEKRTNKSKNVETTTELVPRDEYNLGDNDVTQTNTTPVKYYSFYTVGNTQYTKEVSVKSYTTDSSNETLYDLKKVCISAVDNVTIVEKSTCDNGYVAQAKYYSSIFADKTDNNPTKATVSHTVSALNNVKNDCNYSVTPDELSCHVSVNNQCSNYFYANDDIVFTLTANYNRNRVKTISYNIGTSKLDTVAAGKYNGKKTYTIAKNTITTPKKVTIYGTVTDGQNIKHCEQTVTIYPNTNKCIFQKTENAIDNTVTISIKSIANKNAIYQIKDSTSNKWMNIQSKKIKKDVKIILEGRILVDGKVIQDCFYEYPEKSSCPECKTSYKPTEYEKIKQHCTNYWNIDRAGYTSYDNCYQDCTAGAGMTCKKTCDTSNLTCVKKYCQDYFTNDGYPTYGDCVNDCSDPNNGLNYYYRTIDNDNPFPQREAHYNWLGYEEYITNDTDDLTPSKGGAYPEYEIKLDKDRMAVINKNTSSYNSKNSKSAYSDYIRLNKTDTGKYKSKFIHEDDPQNGGFKSYFTYIEGSKVGG